MYGTTQKPGESVEVYAQRFRRNAKKTGNAISDTGKAMDYNQLLNGQHYY